MARQFDGSTDGIVYASPETIAGAFTFAAWVKPDAVNARVRFLDVMQSGDAAEHIILELFPRDYDGTLNFVCLCATRHVTIRADNSKVLATGSWQSVIFTWTGTVSSTGARMYIDGTEVGYAFNQSGGGTQTTAGGSWSIGETFGGTGAFDGGMANVGTWGRILTPGEREAYDKGFSPKCFPEGLILAPDFVRSANDLISGIVPTVSGTTVVSHPRTIFPGQTFVGVTSPGSGGALSGTAAGTSTATGALTGSGALSGASAGTSTATGTLGSSDSLAGTAAGTSTATGALTGSGALAGTAAGTSTATGTLTGGEFEDFTTYTESDASARLTVTPPKVLAAGLRLDDDAWTVYDFGADYYAQNFSHEFEIFVDSGSDQSGTATAWALTNSIRTRTGIIDNSEDMLCVLFGEFSGNLYFTAAEYNAGSLTAETGVTTLSLDTLYYITLSRDESVGTYGTLYAKVYSDAARTTLVLTKTVTLTEKQDFRYGMAMQSTGAASGAAVFAGYIQNLELVSNGTEGAITGTAAGTSTATGAITGSGALAGAAAGTSTASGVLTGTGALVGTTAGTSTATGVLTASGALVGTVTAFATASGVLLGSGDLAGTATATSTATGTLTDGIPLTGFSISLTVQASDPVLTVSEIDHTLSTLADDLILTCDTKEVP